jgi:hypothetical protein
MTRLLIATAALVLVVVCLPHSAMAQAYFGNTSGLGGVGGGVTTGPGMATCNVQVSEECRRLMAERKAWLAARMRSNVPRRPAR